ncbi:uncharacterized protein LOC135845649 [Planococcus citri]|uniref:uncharacterized protein LOC135845649 n=1 Tax=Planococcus citri TaxID=170843 RepID=UPI0031F88D13
MLGKALEGELLLELITSKSEEMKIGKAPKDENYDNTKYYFINRLFFRCIQVNIDEMFKKNKSDFVLIKKTQEITKHNVQATHDIVVIADTDEDFMKCCESYNNNVHCLKNSGDDCVWQQSRGSESKLRKFIKTTEQSRENHELKSVLDIPDKPKRVNIDEMFKETKTGFVLIDKTQEINEYNVQATHDIVLIADTNEDFIECCDSYNNNIHWLKKSGDDRVWQQSRGSKSKLRKFIKTTEQSRENHELKSVLDIPDKVVLIAAEAGMGKSVILSHLAINTPTVPYPVWIVRCNLMDYSSDFSAWMKSEKIISAKEAVKFLYKITKLKLFKECSKNNVKEEQIPDNILHFRDDGKVDLKSNELKRNKNVSILALFEVELFTVLYNQGRIVLLLDGFDEITPEYKHQVIKVIENLKHQLEKIWMTTRPIHIYGEVEDEFSTFSYQLTSFTLDDQKKFLMEFWREKLKHVELNEQCSTVYIDKLLDKFSSCTNDLQIKFVSVPLQVYMLAEIFSVAFQEFHESGNSELSEKDQEILNERLNLNSLYQKFTLMKYHVEQKKINPKYDYHICKVGWDKVDDMLYKGYLEWHRKLAIRVTFSEDEINKFPPKVKNVIENVEEGLLKSGIVYRNSNGIPIFIHQTFAEYFTADFLWLQFKLIGFDDCEKFIDDIIFGKLIKDNKKEICEFLKSIAEKDLKDNKMIFESKKLETLMLKLFNVIIKGFLYGGSTNEKMDLDSYDHYYRLYELLWIIEVALSSCQVSVPESIGNWYCDDCKIDEQQYDLLRACIQWGYAELVKALILIKKNSKQFLEFRLMQEYDEIHNWRDSLLVIAIDHDHQHIAEFFLNVYNIYWKDDNGNTLISWALFEKDFKVLDFLSNMKVIDYGKPYMGNHQQKLLFLEGMYVGSSNIIEFLMDKTDIHIVDEFFSSHEWNRFSFHLGVSLFTSDEKVIELGMKHGIDFSNTMNIVLSHILQNFLRETLCNSLSEVLEMSELILKSGGTYNCKNIKISDQASSEPVHGILNDFSQNFDFKTFSSEREHKTTTLYYSECLYLICMLLFKAEVIIRGKFYIKIFDLSGTRIWIKSDDIINKDGQQNPLLDEQGFVLTQNALEKVLSFMNTEPKTCDGYPKDLILDNHLSALNSSQQVNYLILSELEKFWLKRLITVSTKYNCRSYVLCEELLREIQRVSSKLKNVAQEMKKISSNKEFLFKNKDLLQILVTESSSNDFCNKLLSAASTIENLGNYHCISEALTKAVKYGQIRLDPEGIYDKSKNFYELLKKLDESYKKLTAAVDSNSDQVIRDMLEQNPDHKKLIIHGQDERFGSPLHYVASKGDAKIIEILLSHGANPNLRLVEDGIPELLSTSKNSEQIEDNESWASDYYSWTPLHLAALNGHVEVVQLLLQKGAKVDLITDVKATNKGNTSLHLATLRDHFDTVVLLLKNGACFDAKNDENKTPLELAEPGSDVELVLQVIDELFRAIKERRKDLVCSLLTAYGSDLLEAILHAKNSDKKTLICIARDSKQDDVVDLLEEKSRSLQS